MNANFKRVASVLYSQFGDQGLTWVQQQVEEFLDTTPQSDRSTESDAAESEDSQGSLSDDDANIYDDANGFSARIEHTVENVAFEAIVSPEQVVDAVMNLVTIAGEVRKFEEAQVTKRIGIAAERDIAITQIRAQQELLQEYLARSFDERSENFTKLFAVVDEALEAHNMTALALGLESVVKLATSSPFQDLRTVEETSAALSNPNHQWDF